MDKPTQYDKTAEQIYQAVGAALSEWENLELTLTCLYTSFLRKPRSFDLIRQYGSDHKTFAVRLGAAERAGRNYFASFPSQENEGDFRQIVVELKNKSNQRNLIAHGLVREVNEGFGLFVPWYAVDRFRKGSDHTNSAEIYMIIKSFRSLRDRVGGLEGRIAAESWPGIWP